MKTTRRKKQPKGGRPREYKNRKSLTITLPSRVVAWLNNRAAIDGVSRNRLAEIHLSAGLGMHKSAELGGNRLEDGVCNSTVDYAIIEDEKPNEATEVILLRLPAKNVADYDDWAKQLGSTRRRLMVRELLIWMQMDNNITAGRTGLRLKFGTKEAVKSGLEPPIGFEARATLLGVRSIKRNSD